MRRAKQQYITFPVYDAVAPTTLKTGVVFDAGDAYVKRDANAKEAVSVPVETDLPGIYGVTLTAAQWDAGWELFYAAHAGCVTVVIFGAMGEHPAAAVVDDALNSATTFKTDLTEDADDFHTGAGLRFESGANAGQVREITGYDGTTKFVAFAAAFSAEPSDGDTFTIVNT
jgi:hypothetical protein